MGVEVHGVPKGAERGNSNRRYWRERRKGVGQESTDEREEEGREEGREEKLKRGYLSVYRHGARRRTQTPGDKLMKKSSSQIIQLPSISINIRRCFLAIDKNGPTSNGDR